MKIKAVFFDMGGVMVRSSVDDISKMTGRLLRIKNFHFLDSPLVKDLSRLLDRGKISEEQFWRKLFKRVNKPFDSSCLRIIPNALKKIRIRVKMKKLVFFLKNRGIKTAVLSNTHKTFNQVHYRLGHYQIFDYLILSSEVGWRKPDKEIFYYALSLVKVKPQEVIFIDNMKENVEAAEAVGMKVILYQNTNQVWREVKRMLF